MPSHTSLHGCIKILWALTFNYGMPSDIPLVGDWDGNGNDTVGVYRNSKFYLRNSNTAGPANLAFNYGVPMFFRGTLTYRGPAQSTRMRSGKNNLYEAVD